MRYLFLCRWRNLLVGACLLVNLFLAPMAPAQSKIQGIHGASEAEYQSWINSLAKEGFRPTTVAGFGVGDVPKFVAIAVRDKVGLPWHARHNLTASAFREEIDKWRAKGYRLLSVSGYSRGHETNFAGVWAKDATPFTAYLDQSSQQYQQTVDAMRKKGFRPEHISGYRVGKSYAFASIFIADSREWVGRHDLTEAEHQKEFDTYSSKGYRPVALTVYPTPEGIRFASVFVRDKTTGWWARHDLTATAYQKEFDNAASVGYVPGPVLGYPSQGEIRYAAVFNKPPRVVNWPLPMSGKAVAELGAFDDAMQKFMEDRGITAGTLAVMKDGQIVLSRGYGYRDPDAGKRLGPDAPFRLASIGKPITAAAIMQLIRQGKLTLATKAFVLLGTKPPPGKTMDKRLLDITIEHLLEHKGGWNRDKAGDPMFKSLKIAKALGKPGPAQAEDVITYMAGQPLQFTPGTKSVYSNFGYCVLGRVIEKVTEKNYTAYIRQDLLAPIGIKSIMLGHTLPDKRRPDEPVYLDPGFGKNVMRPNSDIQVPAPDGTFYVESMDSHGGLIGSAPDLVRFLNAYWMDGTPRKAGESRSYTFFGNLPGTWTLILQRPDGVNIAALFNQSADPSGQSYDPIAPILNKTTKSIKTWP